MVGTVYTGRSGLDSNSRNLVSLEMFTNIKSIIWENTNHTEISKPANCLEPTREKVDPSSKVFPIISSHHCPAELPSRPICQQCKDEQLISWVNWSRQKKDKR